MLSRDRDPADDPRVAHRAPGSVAADERAAVDRASVVGRVFCGGPSPSSRRRASGRAGGLPALPDPQGGVPARVLQDGRGGRRSLCAHPDSGRRYGALPKRIRADAHERLADWIEANAPERARNTRQIVGYHLEQAYRLCSSSSSDAAHRFAGKRATAVLASAGRRASSAGTCRGGESLREPRRCSPRRAGTGRAVLPARVRAAGDRRFLGAAECGRGDDEDRRPPPATPGSRPTRSWSPGVPGWAPTQRAGQPRPRRRRRGRSPSSRRLGDERGLAEGWSLLGLVGVMNAQLAPPRRPGASRGYAARAGVRRDELESLAWIPLLMWAGPTPVEQGLRRCAELLERSGGDKKAASSALMAQAAFEALGGHAPEARAGTSRARRLEELLHQTTNLLAQVTQHAAVVVGPRAESATVRSVQIVGLSARHAMVVAVLQQRHRRQPDDRARCRHVRRSYLGRVGTSAVGDGRSLDRPCRRTAFLR